MTAPTFDTLVEDFEFLDDWEERYKYVIELGKNMPELPEAQRIPENKVQGCVSQVWITSRLEPDADTSHHELHFEGDSDALIVKGLIAILRILLSGQRAEEIVMMDVHERLGQLELNDHLTPQRSNGLAAMINRLKADASKAA